MKKLISILLISLTGTVFADKFSKDLFAKNLGKRNGILNTSNASCYIDVKEVGNSYSVLLFGNSDFINYTAYASGDKDLKNNFDRAGNLFVSYDYVEATNGGWLNSSAGITRSWDMRVYFSKKQITSFSVIRADGIEHRCVLN